MGLRLYYLVCKGRMLAACSRRSALLDVRNMTSKAFECMESKQEQGRSDNILCTWTAERTTFCEELSGLSQIQRDFLFLELPGHLILCAAPV